MRQETRRERYNNKIKTAHKLPVSFVTINFDFNDNLAFLIRTAACFGMKNVYVIGSIPSKGLLNPKSGSLCDYVNLVSFPNPMKFLEYVKTNNIKLVSAEINDTAKNIYDYKFYPEQETAIVLGHETVGIPVEILKNSDNVFIPMLGAGFCLNTSQTGTAFITEYTRQYLKE